MKIDRKNLLKKLNEMTPGLSAKGILEQSKSFVFAGGSLVTFNDEILARMDSPLGDLTMVVDASDLLKVLEKLPDDELEIKKKKHELVLKGSKKAAGISLTAEVLLPFDAVPTPKNFKTIGSGSISKLLIQAAMTCGKDESQPLTTYVHVREDLIEACDNYRLLRAVGDTGFPDEVLIPATTLLALKAVSFVKVAIGKGWCHFLTKTGTTYSLRTSHEEYSIDTSDIIKLRKPKKIRLPSNLPEVLERASIMGNTGYDAYAEVTLSKNKLTIKTQKEGGWYRERRKVKWDGDDMTLHVHPELLVDLLSRARKVELDETRMKITTKRITFVIRISIAPRSEVV